MGYRVTLKVNCDEYREDIYYAVDDEDLYRYLSNLFVVSGYVTINDVIITQEPRPLEGKHMIIDSFANLLNTMIENQFRLGADPLDVLETITLWYANTCNALHIIIPKPEVKADAETPESEVRGDNIEFRPSGQPVDHEG